MNITYYLGAGASAEALPTYENFEIKFKEFYEKIKSINNNIIKNGQQDSDLKNTILQIEDVLREFEHHRTPDTIAKKYFHQGNGKIDSLKRIIGLFFLVQQFYKIDRRYDSFIASILEPIEKKLQLKGNYKIITWNYDFQFELTFSLYDMRNFNSILQKLSVFPNISPKNNHYSYNSSKFSIVHLNGIAYCGTESFNPLSKLFNKESDEISHYIKTFEASQRTHYPDGKGGANYFRFAWETYHNELEKESSPKSIAINIAKQTDVLVIIGYSFPGFNYEVDKEILYSMEKLQKVYVQDFNRETKDILYNTFLKGRIDYDKIEFVENRKSFHIPIEGNFE